MAELGSSICGYNHSEKQRLHQHTPMLTGLGSMMLRRTHDCQRTARVLSPVVRSTDKFLSWTGASFQRRLWVFVHAGSCLP